MISILHDVRSSHNVGSMFRTSDAAGVEKIYLTGYTPGPLDPRLKPRPDFLKVSLGAEHFIPWEAVKSVTRLIDKLKKQGYRIYVGEQAKDSINYNSVRVKRNEKVALVVGNEVTGLSPTILRRADKILEIPMRGQKESLNVSVAFGIVVYSLLRHNN